MDSSDSRKNWFQFVKTTRARLERKRKTKISHRDAMKEASALWPAEKIKLAKRAKRAARKKLKLEAESKTE